MSGFLAGKVWQSALHPDLKPLAAALADIANDDGTRIYPSVAYMCWLLGRSERTVQVGLTRLRELDVLQVVKYGRGGRHKSTEYHLVESSLPKREPWRNPAVTAGYSRNPAVNAQKPRSLQQKTVLPTAPEPSLNRYRNKESVPTMINETDEKKKQRHKLQARSRLRYLERILRENPGLIAAEKARIQLMIDDLKRKLAA